MNKKLKDNIEKQFNKFINIINELKKENDELRMYKEKYTNMNNDIEEIINNSEKLLEKLVISPSSTNVPKSIELITFKQNSDVNYLIKPFNLDISNISLKQSSDDNISTKQLNKLKIYFDNKRIRRNKKYYNYYKKHYNSESDVENDNIYYPKLDLNTFSNKDIIKKLLTFD